MAKVTPSALIGIITGSIGTQTFAMWRHDVNYVKTKPASVSNPNTGLQQAIRDAISAAASAWRALGADERALWETYALSQPHRAIERGGQYSIIKGNTGTGSGYHAFVSANGLLASAGLASVTAAPIAIAQPTPPTDLSGSWDGTTLSITWTTPLVATANSIVRVWIFTPQELFHRQILAVAAYDVDSMAQTGVRSALGNTLLFSAMATDTNIWIQADTINPEGRGSAPSECIFCPYVSP